MTDEHSDLQKGIDKELDDQIAKRRAEVQSSLPPLEEPEVVVRPLPNVDFLRGALPHPDIFAVVIQQTGSQQRETVYVKAHSANDAIKPFNNDWITVRPASNQEIDEGCEVTIDLTKGSTGPQVINDAINTGHETITMEEATENARIAATKVVMIDRIRYVKSYDDLLDIILVFSRNKDITDTIFSYSYRRGFAGMMSYSVIKEFLMIGATFDEKLKTQATDCLFVGITIRDWFDGYVKTRRMGPSEDHLPLPYRHARLIASRIEAKELVVYRSPNN